MSNQSEIDRIKQNVANTYAVLEALGANIPAEQNSNNLAATAGSAKVVLYKEQTLTDAQKAQARENIGAASADDVKQLSNEKVAEKSIAKHITSVHAPSPQLPANAESGADFNLHTFADFGAGYHSYFDDLVARYPNYLVREFLGKDSSETLPMYRYTLGNRYWNAWHKENYPRMYAWKNGDKVIYSKSVSPRIGDLMYNQGHIGETYGGGQSITTEVPPKAVILRGYRYSHSGGAFQASTTNEAACIVPLYAMGVTKSFTIQLTNAGKASRLLHYAGNTNTAFPMELGSIGAKEDTTLEYTHTTNFNENYNYMVFFLAWAGDESVRDDWALRNVQITINGVQLDVVNVKPESVEEATNYAKQASPSTTTTVSSDGYPVTAVSATNRSRTINGLEFVRYAEGDVNPTLLYSEAVNTKPVLYGFTYDSNWERQANITEYGNGTMISGGITYIRYPYGDLKKDKSKPIHITIIANEHGGDTEPAIPAVVSARLIRDLCQGRYADNPVMAFLRDNAQLTIIPVVNPHGLNRFVAGEFNGYFNANGVNINRNYDTVGWDTTKALNAALNTTNSCGEYAGSENECQYVMNTIVDSKSVVAMSIHAISCLVDDHERCNYQGQNPDGGYTEDKIEDMRIDMKSSYNLNFLPYDPLECPPETTSKSPSYITQCGAYGGIVEFQCHDPLATADEISTDASMFTSVVMEQNYSLLLKFIAMWLSDYLEAVSE